MASLAVVDGSMATLVTFMCVYVYVGVCTCILLSLCVKVRARKIMS